jgi:hypothetical protein
MAGFARMYKLGRRTRGREGSRYFSRNMAALAHSADNDPTFGAGEQLNRLTKICIHRIRKRFQSLGLKYKDSPGYFGIFDALVASCHGRYSGSGFACHNVKTRTRTRTALTLGLHPTEASENHAKTVDIS